MALSADNRLRRPADFQHVLTSAQKAGAARRAGRARDRLLLISAVSTTKPDSRIGLAVSKRVGGSVVRNRVKRRLREIFRELVVDAGASQKDEASWDVVATARPEAAEATYEELRSSARRLIAKVKAGR